MNCTNLLDNGNPCGDEGEICDSCFHDAVTGHSWLRNISWGALTGKLSEKDKQDLRDAGRA